MFNKKKVLTSDEVDSGSKSVRKHSASRHVKKHVHWYWLIFFLLFFLALPLLVGITSDGTSYFLRILQSISLWLFMLGFSLYGIFAPRETYFRRMSSEFTMTHEIAIVVLRIFYVVWFVVSIYYLFPMVNGIFQKFVLNKPYEIVSDTVIYAHSTSGKYANSDGNCTYMYCHLKLQGNPDREFEYDDAPYIEEGRQYQFVVLPGSDLIVGSSSL